MFSLERPIISSPVTWNLCPPNVYTHSRILTMYIINTYTVELKNKIMRLFFGFFIFFTWNAKYEFLGSSIPRFVCIRCATRRCQIFTYTVVFNLTYRTWPLLFICFIYLRVCNGTDLGCSSSLSGMNVNNIMWVKIYKKKKITI